MTQNNRRAGGSGISKPGLRTSAKTKKLKNRIHRKVREGTPLSNREARKWKAMKRTALSVVAAAAEQARKEQDQSKGIQQAAARGFKLDINGKWRNSKGHFVKNDELIELGL